MLIGKEQLLREKYTGCFEEFFSPGGIEDLIVGKIPSRRTKYLIQLLLEKKVMIRDYVFIMLPRLRVAIVVLTFV